jgi:hypothetical protein
MMQARTFSKTFLVTWSYDWSAWSIRHESPSRATSRSVTRFVTTYPLPRCVRNSTRQKWKSIKHRSRLIMLI